LRIAYLNGSPKKQASASANILGAMEERLAEHDAVRLRVPSDSVTETASQFASLDALVLAFPLYVDGIPAHLLGFLEALERALYPTFSAPDASETPVRNPDLKAVKLYVLINCGFMEPEHTEVAVDMIKLWCERVGFIFGRAASFGGGGMASSLKIGRGPGKDYGAALDALAEDVTAGRGGETILTRVNIPRSLYIKGAHYGWRRAARKRGVKVRDLYRRP
jgi:hypothetical protein